MSTTTNQYAVRRYELPLASPGTAIISMPENANILSCEVHASKIIVWASVDVAGKECQWTFKLYSTDQIMDASTEDVWEMALGTVHVNGVTLHIFVLYDDGK